MGDPMSRLRKFGAKPAVQEHYQQVLNLLKSTDIMDVMQGVSQLSSELVMAQDDVLASFPLDLLTPPLVDCLQKEGIEEVGLYAINCLNQLAEALPNVCGIIAACGGVPAVCNKLMNLSYIDVSEQAIKLLDKLAYEHAPLILQEGGLSTLLNVMDFFEAATQKQVLSILVNLARGVQSQEVYLQHVAPTLPLIASFLQYRNKESIPTNEKALDFYISLISSLERLHRGSHDSLKVHLESMHEQGVVQNSMELAQMARQLLPQVFRLLTGLCRGSAKVLGEWLQMGGGQLLGNSLDCDEDAPKVATYVVDALQLIDSILPKAGGRESEISALYRTHPALLTNLGETIIPKLFLLYERFINSTVRQLTLDILEKLLAHEHFLQTTSPSHAASFLAELLCSKDITTVKKALSIAKVLYEKVPDQVARYFIKEGVVARIESLRKSELRMDPGAMSPFLRESGSRNRLRMLLEGMDSSTEPRLLDQFLRHIRRRGLEDEDFDFSERLRRSASERTDPMGDLRSEIDSLSTEVLATSQRLAKDSYSHVLHELKGISNRLFASASDDPEPHLSQLLQLMAAPEGVSAFEVSASGVCATLWRWLTAAQDFSEGAQPKKMTSAATRIKEFLKSVLKDRGDSKSHFQSLIELFSEVVAHDQQLPLTLHESPMGGSSLVMGLRTLSQRVQLQLVYTPDPLPPDAPADLRADFEVKNSLFGDVGSLGIALEQYQSLDSIADLLSKVKATEDLDVFKTSFYRSATRFRGISQGQMNLIRQHVRLQQMMSDNFDLRTSLSELGLITDGNEELLAELQEQLSRDPEEDEGFEGSEASEEAEAELIQPRERKVSHYPSDLVAKLYVNNTEVAPKATVFEVMNKFLGPLSDEPLALQFKFVKKEAMEPSEAPRFACGPHAALWQLLKDAANVGMDVSDPLHFPLRLLKLLSSLNRLLPGLLTRGSIYFPGCEDNGVRLPIPAQVFQSQKLSALLGKQTQDVVAVLGRTVSDWVWKLPLKCSFAFAFLARVHLMRVGGVSPAKALQYCAGKLKAAGDLLQVRTQRHKVRVDREHVLDIALRTLGDRTLLQHSTLEFEYPNEDGTGAGPTLEFYSLTAREIRQLKHWRNTGEECGLFPSPVESPDSDEMFDFIGRFVGKAISEEKVVDLPLSPAFWKLVFGGQLNLGDLQHVDKGLSRHLTDLAEVANRRYWILTNPAFSPEMKDRQLSQLTLKGTPIPDLALTFVLPGFELQLKDRGKDTLVTLDTLDEYIHLVAEKTLMLVRQAAAFRRGLELSVSVKTLSGFSGEELETIVCGEDGGKWDEATLRDAVIPAHGYTKSSSVYCNVLQVMSELTSQEKKLCLQFLTGSPRLPIGGTCHAGFKALSPPLTIVRKNVNGSVDAFLPSVMTCVLCSCQNYLKVPDYSSLETLRKNFKYAFTEAHDTFHLS